MSESVAIVRCPNYQQDLVDQSIHQALEMLGGMSQFIHPGQKVLLKVNLLSASAPEAAVTTHPAVVEAMVKAVQLAGGCPIIGDSPGTSVRYTESGLRSLYRITGMTGVAERTGADLMFDTRSEEITFPKGKLLKRMEVIRPVLEADVLISLPKFKNHVLTTFTGATKNMFGVIPGAQKALLHATSKTLTNFVETLLDIFQWSTPVLTIMDGVIGMEGDGPSGGQPKDVGVVLASRDGVALDVIATQIAGIPAESIPLLRQSVSRGWWSGRVEDIPILGAPLSEVKLHDFVPPRPNRHPDNLGVPFGRHLAPVLVNWLAVKPVPQAGRCTACGSCVRACPRDAIEIRQKLAHVDYGLCIHCYCCHEMCPEKAIDLAQPWLAKLLRI